MRTAITLLAGALVILVAGCGRTSAPNKPLDVDYYTCTMHPFVHADAPGKCPVCGMTLVPVMKAGAGLPSPNETKTGTAKEFVVPMERQQQIGVTYAVVEQKPLEREIHAAGSIAVDPQKHWTFVARVDGYVQQLYIASAGELVERGQPLLSIYSPELLTTQRELVMLLQMRDQARTADGRETPSRLIVAAEARLRQWNVTPEQIADLEKSRQPNETMILRSPFRGLVLELAAQQGQSVKSGDRLVDVAELSSIWAWADFYESELAHVEAGQKVRVTSRSLPGEAFEGRIALVSAVVDQKQRISRARIDLPNPEFKLRPGMYVEVTLSVSAGEKLAVPASAILPTGRHNIAFVDKGAGKLEPRDVQLAGQFGDCYAVASGLTKGERVVTSANFLIDAEARVQNALGDFEQH
jgi:membrane fusion protein, copper/silver efflux system